MIVYESNNELMHYGVLGMKWGVRKQPLKDAKRNARKIKRNLAADKRNVGMRTQNVVAAAKAYKKAKQNYRKEYGRSVSNWHRLVDSDDALRTRIEKADSNVKKARGYYNNTVKEQKKAKKSYFDTERQYKESVKRVNALYRKMGSTKVKHISYTDYSYGKGVSERFIKTGITVSDIPLYGRYRTSKYIVGRDYKNA